MRNTTIQAQLRGLENRRSKSADLTYDGIDRTIDDLRFEAITEDIEEQYFMLKRIQDATWSANFRLMLIMVPLYIYLGGQSVVYLLSGV